MHLALLYIAEYVHGKTAAQHGRIQSYAQNYVDECKNCINLESYREI